jgi:hypothetical protein
MSAQHGRKHLPQPLNNRSIRGIFLGGRLLSATRFTPRNMHMHTVLQERAAELSRLASAVRTSLAQAEALIPVVNKHLSDLAEMGMADLQVEGPAVYSRPAGLSARHTDDHFIYQAVVVLPGGIGAVVWHSGDFAEYRQCPYGQQIDLAPHFVEFAKCPPVVKALLVTQASSMVASLMEDVRLLGS